MSYYGKKFSHAYARDIMASSKTVIPVLTGITKASSKWEVSGDEITFINDGFRVLKDGRKEYYSKDVYIYHPTKWGWYIRTIDSINGEKALQKNYADIFQEMIKDYGIK